MRRWVCLSVTALLLFGACSNDAGPRPGDVVIEDSPLGDDVYFYFAAETSEGNAENEARARMSDASLEVEEVETEVDDGVVKVKIATTLDTKENFLERSVDDSLFESLAADGRALLKVQSSGRLQSEGQLVESSSWARTYEVGEGDARYEHSLPYILTLLLVALAVTLIPYPLTRRYVARLRRKDLEKVEKVHRLQKATMLISMLAALGFIVFAFGSGALSAGLVLLESMVSLPEALNGPAMMLLLLVPMLIVLVLSLKPLIAYQRELRDIEQSPAERRRRTARGLLFGLVLFVWIIGRNIIQEATTGWVSAVVAVLSILVFFAAIPFLLRFAMGRSEMDPALHEELMELAHSNGFKVRDICAVQGRSEKHGNALMVGVIPGLRFIFVTDYLIENLSRDELKAIVAHEIGHGRKHHLLIKLGAVLAIVLGIAALIGVAVALGAEGSGAVAVFALLAPILMIAGLVVGQGIVGIKLEKAADDFACRVMGVETTVSALNKLAEMNTAKRKTGRIFNLLGQHPGIQERVDRLQTA